MTESDFKAAQQSKQVKEIKPAVIPQPSPESLAIAALKSQFDTYQRFLEALRVGMSIKGSGTLVAGVLTVNDTRIQATSICITNFSSSGSHSNLTTAATHFLLTECIAGTATITSTDTSDTNTVNYIIIF